MPPRSLSLATTRRIAIAIAMVCVFFSAPQSPQAAGKPEVIGAYIARGLKDVDGAADDFRLLGQAGVNTVIDYRLAAPEPGNASQAKNWRRYLDAAEQSGIGIWFYAGRYLIGATPSTAAARTSALLQAVKQVQDEAAITGWYMHDEVWPSLSRGDPKYGYVITLDQLLDLYAQLHQLDPTRPQVAVWPELKDFAAFSQGLTAASFSFGRPAWADSEAAYEEMLRRLVAGVCDIPMLDVYPVGAPRPFGEQVYRKAVASRLDRLAALKAADQPLYFVFQCFSLAQNDPQKLADCQFPTQDEMLSMLSAAARSGASGAIAYCWYNLANPIPSRRIAGIEQAKANVLTVLGYLSARGWPR